MPRAARAKSKTGIYHMILRGINRQIIFEDEKDSIKFLQTFREYKEESEYEIYAETTGTVPAVCLSKSKEEQQQDDVRQLFVEKMDGGYTDLQIEEAQTLWKEFKQNNKKYISKPEKWAAAVEYIVSRSNFIDISKEEIGGKYGILPYSVISRVKIIEKILSLR